MGYVFLLALSFVGTIYSENKNRLETGVVCRATVVRTFHVYWVEAVRTTVQPCSTYTYDR